MRLIISSWMQMIIAFPLLKILQRLVRVSLREISSFHLFHLFVEEQPQWPFSA